ncbi:hypothetical protein RvY_14593 [Ramazzottius varieornatus]|uniref:Putative auto-transporter adhesin head GIN domain-containing protein n=1 Tax=Ramazzottius varieornatus TaxID=947166 RepID=A0A1D1VRY5_RAMVA|nr:hypothetical protein RvY_14593 [Ramazzottius varieornatus]
MVSFATLICIAGIFFICNIGVVVPQATETRNVSDFTGIAVAGPFSVTLTTGTTESLKLLGNKDVINNIETPVENGTLKIRFIDWNVRFTGIFQVQITVKSIITLIADGSSQVNIQSPLNPQSLRVVVGGSAQVTSKNINTEFLNAVVSGSAGFISDINSKNLNAVISDSGVLTLSGTVTNANVVVSGSGVFHGRDLNAGTVSTVVSGSGRSEVRSDDIVKAQVIELGVVRYSGKAKVEAEKHDQGSVEKA